MAHGHSAARQRRWAAGLALLMAGAARAGDGDDLLRQSLVEGFADFVMRRALPAGTQTDAERSRYGITHEAELWRAFAADLASGYAARWNARSD